MPPIPIYADAPITAAKADGVTPQTAPPPTRTTELPATTTSTGNNSYPAAQPGAVAGPAPTGSVSRQLPPAPAPTSTTSIQTDGPPPPQPGAAPVPFTTASHSNGYNPNSPAVPRAQPMPHQLNIPPPTTSALPTHSTVSASPTSQSHRPVTLPMGPVHSRPTSISTHPPGYQQNPYAAEMTSAQRASLEAAEAADKGRKSGRNSISEWIAGEDDGFGSPATTGGTATAWLKGVASQASQWANKANEMASKKLG
ncbi:hypothetical protein E4T44_09104 [Aureobasidium sp. EXF-8845]|nr:hypothetical protein E4T45_10323 [Aureobasidium sp. EXF-8846]KAI4834003.1 hypothetical protein E4T44_09104 [Aureobasidium sp. EXF-8845]